MDTALISALPALITLVTHGIEAIERSREISAAEKAEQLLELKLQLDGLQARLVATSAKVNAVTFNAKPPAAPR